MAYIRWLLHSVSEEQARAIVEWAAGESLMVFIEARSDAGPHPEGRRPINLIELSEHLTSLGMAIVEQREGYGLSVEEGDDPCLLRVMARWP